MNRDKRRKLLRLAAGAAAGMLLLEAPAAHAAGAARGTPAAAALLDQASAWIDRLRAQGQRRLLYPISRTQREFRIGYGASCTLVEQLAQHGEWTIRYMGDGTRYAWIHPKRPA